MLSKNIIYYNLLNFKFDVNVNTEILKSKSVLEFLVTVKEKDSECYVKGEEATYEEAVHLDSKGPCI